MFIRRLPKFECHMPTTVEEAAELLSQHGDKAQALAGGTDLLVAMKQRHVSAEHVVNLKGITAIQGISQNGSNQIRVGGLTTLGDLERSALVKEKLPPLWDAIHVMASVQIRNLGTIGGNLCSAWPSADSVPPLIVLGATVNLHGTQGKRSVPVEEFFAGPGQSVKQPDEILTEVLIPVPPENSSGTYIKLMRRNAMDLALAGAAVLIEMDADKKQCRDAKIALSAVAPTPVRSLEAEASLVNRDFDADLAAAAGQIASNHISPRDSIRASGVYRKEMIGVLVKRALLKSYERIQDHRN